MYALRLLPVGDSALLIITIPFASLGSCLSLSCLLLLKQLLQCQCKPLR